MSPDRKYCNKGHLRIPENLYAGRCRTCALARSSLIHRLNRKRDPNRIRYPQHYSPKQRFSDSKYGALTRKLSWGLSFDYYCSLIIQPCFYCHQSLQKTKCGLDRIDNTKGYIIGNIRPCCKICNIMKNNLSEKEFYTHIQRIYSYFPVERIV